MAYIWQHSKWPVLHWDTERLLPLLTTVTYERVVAMTTDATANYNRPLTRRRLCKWQKPLFTTGKCGLATIATGRYQDGPVHLVSGPMGKEKVHFEAPPADRLSREMQIKVLNTLLDGLEGKLNSSKWAKLTKSSRDTALRGIKDLITRGPLTQDVGGGRSTSYSLVLNP
jgi:hypothetical protein